MNTAGTKRLGHFERQQLPSDFIDDARLQIAIVGLGDLGCAMMHALAQKTWVRAIDCYSGSYGGDYSAVQADFFLGCRKVAFHDSLLDALLPQPDLLLITTGCPIPKLEGSSRQELLSTLYEKSLPKLLPVFGAIKDLKYSGLVSVFTNPPGAHLNTAAEQFGLPIAQLTSFSPDAARAHGLLVQVIENYCLVKESGIGLTVESLFAPGFRGAEYRKLRQNGDGANGQLLCALECEDIELCVVGEHGSEIPLLESCLIGGIPIGQIDPIFSGTEFAEEFTRRLRGIGDRVVRNHQKRGGGIFFTVPESAVRMIEHCAQVITGSRDYCDVYVHTYLPELKAFFNLPARIRGRPLRVFVSPEFCLSSLPFTIREELIWQGQIQRQFLTTNLYQCAPAC